MTWLVLMFFFGLSAGVIGKIKGSSFFIWFIVGTVVPVIGLITAVAYRSERDELRRQCPTCGRVTKIYDAICTNCGTELDFPDTAIAPESQARGAR